MFMIKINEEYLVKILNEDDFGNGITRINNFVIFVPHSFCDEELLIKIIKINKRFGIGHILEIKKENSKRIKYSCSNYPLCGGCDYLHMNLEDENIKKINYIEKLFNLKLDNYYSDNIHRNKVIFQVKNNQIGFFQKETNHIIGINDCLLLNKKTLEVYNYFKNINLSNIEQVLVRESFFNQELLINVLGRFNNFDDLIKIIKPTSLYINNKLVYGKEYIIENINNLKYIITPNSFFQTNSPTMIKLYDQIKAYAIKGNKLLDLYCGTGSIGIYLSDNFKSIIGIDNIKENIINANKNKELNQITNITFKLEDASYKVNDSFDTIIVDPPRSGLSKQVIKNLINSKAKTIIYVSCNPLTLKRDLDLLNNYYKLDKLSAFNMFPRTKHIECVCVMKLH